MDCIIYTLYLCVSVRMCVCICKNTRNNFCCFVSSKFNKIWKKPYLLKYFLSQHLHLRFPSNLKLTPLLKSDYLLQPKEKQQLPTRLFPSSSESSVWDDRRLMLLVIVAEAADVVDWEVPVSNVSSRMSFTARGFSGGVSAANISGGGGGNKSAITCTAPFWGFKGASLVLCCSACDL